MVGNSNDTVLLNDIIRRVLGRAQKEPLGLLREDGKWPDSATFIP